MSNPATVVNGWLQEIMNPQSMNLDLASLTGLGIDSHFCAPYNKDFWITPDESGR
jgi:hypothetical protein